MSRHLPQRSKLLPALTMPTRSRLPAANHGFATGDQVVISGVLGNTNANGQWTITEVNANKFTLDGRSGVGGGTYTANTGTVYSLLLRFRNPRTAPPFPPAPDSPGIS